MGIKIEKQFLLILKTKGNSDAFTNTNPIVFIVNAERYNISPIPVVRVYILHQNPHFQSCRGFFGADLFCTFTLSSRGDMVSHSSPSEIWSHLEMVVVGGSHNKIRR